MVVDSSIVVALLIEPARLGSAIAQRIRGTDLIAPHLLPFEVINVLRRRLNAALLSEAEAQLALGGLLRIPLELWPFELLSEHAWSHRHNLSGYDASYVALAERLQCPLLTVDARIASAPGVQCEVELVG